MTPEPEGIAPYDLVLPSRLLVPDHSVLRNMNTPEAQARFAQAAAERQAQHEALVAAVARAMKDWEELWDRVEENVIATSVLLIHKPTTDADYRPVVCTHCQQSAGCEDTEPADWPCTTYQAVVRAAEPVDVETCQDLNALGLIRPEP